MAQLYLHGGGGEAATLAPYVAALPPDRPGPLLLVIAEVAAEDRVASFQAYQAIFQALGEPASALAAAYVTPEQPLTAARCAELRPRGIFVCGGATPFYHQALCGDQGWLVYLREAGIPYGGTSAGAAIAAETAILGGWQVADGERRRGILFSGAGEGLELLTVEPGLGLVPFAVDVHASQWGTLLRLVHAVARGLVAEGWAIDENTLLEVDGGQVAVSGHGQAYLVRRAEGGGVTVVIHPAS
jgi:cyanophycinase